MVRKGSVFKWDVEFGSLTLELLLSSLCKKLNLSSDQSPTVWFHDKTLHEDVRIPNEIQMLDMFQMYKEERSCQVIVGVFDKTGAMDAEFDALEPIGVVPPVVELGNLDAVLSTEPSTKSKGVTDDDNPKTAAVNLDVEADIFDNAEEYVGIDDETLYIPVPTPQAIENTDATANNTQTDNAQPSQTAFVADYNDNGISVVDEEEVAGEFGSTCST